MNNYILIGFMGVGKGSVARETVKRTDIMAVDTDDLIESMENLKIKKIFELRGEEYFRTIERKVATWLSSSVNNTLISTGGGFYKVPELKQIGKVIYLSAPFDEIYERMTQHPNAIRKLKKRPLFQDIDKARALYNERLPIYKEVCDIEIGGEGKTLSELTDAVVSVIKGEA